MDSRSPTDQERREINDLHAAFRRWPLIGVVSMTTLLLGQFLVPSVPVKIGMVILAVVFFVYWSLAFAVLKKCPRCQARMTLPRGNCTTCGLRLDIGNNE